MDAKFIDQAQWQVLAAMYEAVKTNIVFSFMV